ncbi:hypothetical protein GALL_154890 [mine drainage metagenome]|uniref:Uncharacterized protein n=1 Tax=mine drainage metagenome TaxID=410659 RepID=A0A1J5SKV5_9ZZZZ
MRHRRYNLILAAMGLFLVYWGTRPASQIAYDKSCRLVGLQPKISAWIYGDTFWEMQLVQTDESLEWLQRAQASDSHALDNEDRNAIEQRMSRLYDQQLAQDSGTDQSHRKAVLHHYDQIAWLSSCDAVIRLKLRQGRR